MSDLFCPACGREETTGTVYPPHCTCGGLWSARDLNSYRVRSDRSASFVTPLWRDPRDPRLWWKREDLSRTGSFKDRGAETLIGLARRAGAARLVLDSSGS